MTKWPSTKILWCLKQVCSSFSKPPTLLFKRAYPSDGSKRLPVLSGFISHGILFVAKHIGLSRPSFVKEREREEAYN